MPRASIIITTHNRVELLKKAIESALVAGDVETIVVDDASSDGTQDHCSRLVGIKYIRLDRNVRTAGARNAGLDAATTPYVAFLDDDDLRLPGSINRQVDLLEDDPESDLVYGRFFSADTDGTYDDRDPLPQDCPEGDVLEQLLRMNFIGLSTCVVRRSVFDKVGAFDTSEGMYGIEDWDMWLRAAEFFKFRAICEPVAIYRMPARGTGQWSSDIAKQFSRVANAYKLKWLKLPGARQLLQSGSISEAELLDVVAERILYDMSTNSIGPRERALKMLAVIRCQPSQLRRANFYKAVVRSFIG